jgi:ATP-dependent DNA ligase
VAEVQRRGYEGLVAKDESSAYRSGRTRAWLKVKLREEDGARRSGNPALFASRLMNFRMG